MGKTFGPLLFCEASTTETDEVYGIITERGWITPRVNGVKFWEYMRDPVYPMRTLTGAKAIARDWLHDQRGPKCSYTIVNSETGKPEFTIEV